MIDIQIDELAGKAFGRRWKTMNSDSLVSKSLNRKRIIVCLLICVSLLSAGVGIGYFIGAKPNESHPTEPLGYAANPAYEYMVGSTAWQMSAEAHALMMQGFHLAEKNIDEMVALLIKSRMDTGGLKIMERKNYISTKKEYALFVI